MKAIEDVQADMGREKPMDRLVCGDVGFGKTEVALRASFRAMMDGKQVAVLVPTTVLAQQHHQTFQDRFKTYPVVIEVLSRFKTPREQTEIIKRVGEGKVDVIIGTHRLLQKDVSFRDLGLVIVDEEHRFGVTHKEKLKQLRQQVDVLTLTATPIPRTLYLSLSGARDMSTIETPPQDRVPVETIHCPVRRAAHQTGHPTRTEPGRPDLFSTQPRPDHRKVRGGLMRLELSQAVVLLTTAWF
jgi:transcription-repair coupling factor (superfamily II helicase)